MIQELFHVERWIFASAFVNRSLLSSFVRHANSSIPVHNTTNSHACSISIIQPRASRYLGIIKISSRASCRAGFYKTFHVEHSQGDQFKLRACGEEEGISVSWSSSSENALNMGVPRGTLSKLTEILSPNSVPRETSCKYTKTLIRSARSGEYFGSRHRYCQSKRWSR